MKTKLQIKIMAVGYFIILFAAINLTAQDHWAKYENNPVLENTAWSDGAGSPVVIFEDDVFKMWFSSGDVIGYAESTDGIDWVTNDEPVIPAGNPGAWDEERMSGSVLRVNDTLKMWYSGSSDNFQYEISIGYAWSLDNIVWHLELDPVLENGEPGNWDETGVFQPVVYYEGGTYHMWYSGFEGLTFWDSMQEGYATSTDGINWVKDTNNPVITLGEDGSFYDTWIIGGSVLFTDNEFHMWFAGWDGYSTSPFKYWRIGHATSADGVEWTVQNNSMPVVDVGPAGSWDDIWACYSSVLIHEGQFKMWYDGKGSKRKIGYAEGFETVEVPGDYATIQEGIDAAYAGEVVLVDTGTYYENINFNGKTITVASKFLLGGDTTYISNTILDGSQSNVPDSNSVVYFISGEDTTSIIKGFTIQGGNGTPSSSWGDGICGGGIFCSQAGPKIEYNQIINNDCEGGGSFVSGGGIFSDTCSDRTTIITNNLISGNTCISYESATGAVTGGGMSVLNDAIITGNTILNNSIFHGANGQAVGGGIECSFAKFIITNNIITKNDVENTGSSRQPWGGGIYGENQQDGTLISGNIIKDNTVEGYIPIGGGIGLWNNTGEIHINKNVVKNNEAIRGGGIAIGVDNIFEITNNIICNNDADPSNSYSMGGGIYLTNGSSSKNSGIGNSGRDLSSHLKNTRSKNLIPVIANNTILENSSYNGGGIVFRYTPDWILAFNNILYDNIADEMGDEIYLSSNTNVHLYNNNVNRDDIDGSGYWEGDENIFVDPEIVDDMCHLGWASECANAGIYTLEIDDVWYTIPLTDIDGDTRPYMETQPDIGVDESAILYVGIKKDNMSESIPTQCYPNPFSSSLTIEYELDNSEKVTLIIYNHLGETITTTERFKETGKHQYIWNAEGLPSGMYYYKLKAGKQLANGKIVKVR